MHQNRTMLIADDDTQILLALHKRLTQAGYHVLTATDGASALDQARSEHLDAISLDVRMPGGVSGLDVARALHADPRTASIPIIFITATADDEFAHASKAVGGRYFLSKPYDAELLLSVLRTIFAADELAEVARLSSAKRRQPVH